MIKERNIFIVGIKGVAMANLALIFQQMGKMVNGSDVEEEFITNWLLKKNNITWQVGFKAEDLPKKTELVIYSASHQGIKNPQVQEAIKRKIRVVSQAEILGELTSKFKMTIAVCGCHGKTTTASLLSYSLLNLKAKPSYLVGSPGFNHFPGGGYHGNNFFVIEADEYGVNPPWDKTPKFLYLKPNYVICTNVDYDHPDIYSDISETKYAFNKFFEQAINKIFYCADDKNLLEVIKNIDQKYVVSFGFNPDASYRILDYQTIEEGSSFRLIFPNKKIFPFFISLFGQKNVSNAAGVISCLHYLGFSIEKISTAIKRFCGTERRFQKQAYLNDIYLFDDYGHHPAEIRATINLVRERFPDRRLLIIFQPHTFSRTAALLKQFAESLEEADFGFIMPIFPSARENPNNYHISSLAIVNQAKKNNLVAVGSKKTLLDLIDQKINFGDIILTMGAGDVYKLKDDIIKIIRSKGKD